MEEKCKFGRPIKSCFLERKMINRDEDIPDECQSCLEVDNLLSGEELDQKKHTEKVPINKSHYYLPGWILSRDGAYYVKPNKK